MRKQTWLIIAAVILALLWLQAEVDRWQLRREIEHVYAGEVTVQTIDADTKSPLSMIFDSHRISDQRWPKNFYMRATDDPSKMVISWIDVGDVNAGVSAEGHERVPLTLNAQTPGELVIPLRRSGAAK